MALCRLRFTNYLQCCHRDEAVYSLLLCSKWCVRHKLVNSSVWWHSELKYLKWADDIVTTTALYTWWIRSLVSVHVSTYCVCHIYTQAFCFLLAVSLDVCTASSVGSFPMQVSCCPLANETAICESPAILGTIPSPNEILQLMNDYKSHLCRHIGLWITI